MSSLICRSKGFSLAMARGGVLVEGQSGRGGGRIRGGVWVWTGNGWELEAGVEGRIEMRGTLCVSDFAPTHAEHLTLSKPTANPLFVLR